MGALRHLLMRAVRRDPGRGDERAFGFRLEQFKGALQAAIPVEESEELS